VCDGVRVCVACRHSSRQAWEVLHKSFGYGSVVIAVAVIFTGLDAIQPEASSVVKALYSNVVVCLGTAFLVLECVRRR
jgi:hypothetical protein